MMLWTSSLLALRSLGTNKLRACLAVLGIVIGTTAVVVMLALGSGAQIRVTNQITALGTDLVVIRPGKRGSQGVSSGTQQNLTVDDLREIFAKVPNIRQAAPVVMGNAQLKYLNQNMRANVIGSSATYLSIRNFEFEGGRGLTDADATAHARVAVLGHAAAEKLFGTEPAVGKALKVNGMSFRVAGVLKAKGDQGWFNPDEMVLVPYTTAMQQMFGLDHLNEIDIQAVSGADQTELQYVARNVLRRRHRLLPDAADDFDIRNQADMLQAFSNIHQIMTLLLGGIAGISLLVGGIGIMNVMLVTVT
jgi:putative ABC transport system permease protein